MDGGLEGQGGWPAYVPNIGKRPVIDQEIAKERVYPGGFQVQKLGGLADG